MSASKEPLFPPSLDGGDIDAKRAEIKAYYRHVHQRYESLFCTIADEKAYFQKADPLRHSLIFYYGHTAVFYINKLKLATLIDNFDMYRAIMRRRS